MKKKAIIILNLIIILLELNSLSFDYGLTSLFYYTELSNLLALITSIILVITSFKKKLPNYVKVLRYISTINLTITFLVVLFVLAPKGNFYNMFILGNMFEHHLLCPLLSLFSFMFLEDYKLKLNNIKYPVIITTIYGFILILLNIFKVIDGPYPFLRVYNQTLLVSITYFIVMTLGCLFISYLIILPKKKWELK